MFGCGVVLMSDAFVQQALAYATADLAVLPIEPRGKRPLGGNGKDHATTDPDTIRAWWQRWPAANIGVRPLPGVVVLDVDPRNGGHDTLAALQRQYGPLPPTLTAETGSGGWHIWLAYSGPTRARLGAGVDVKTATGYVIAPPSVHECGGTYRWSCQLPTAPAPGWVTRLLAPPMPTTAVPNRAAGDASGLVRTVRDAARGNRNNALLWAACRAFESGANQDILDQLTAAAIHAGLTEPEALATLGSARRTTQGASQ